jgi:hypothetical protein
MSNAMRSNIAIVGGGLTGCLAALEFADRGHFVTIFEREADLLTRASIANEGKMHLGYTYSADRSFQTAKRLIDDALVFRDIVERWVPHSDFESCLYDTFDYLVPKTSDIPVDTITHHFEKVEEYISERSHELGLNYMGKQSPGNFRLLEHKSSDQQKYFTTQEMGIWPVGLAAHVKSAVSNHPRVTVVYKQTVERIAALGKRWRLVLRDSENEHDGPFDIVVNAAWAARRGIDSNSGFSDGQNWYTRYKFGVLLENVSTFFGGDIPPNTTVTSGAYGDNVYLPQIDTLYTSWYPVGMCFSTDELLTDVTSPELGDRKELAKKTWLGYAAVLKEFERLDYDAAAKSSSIIGDFIMARGRSDIQDPASELHQRLGNVPVELAPGYWTVETGKYTSAPRCAMQCAQLALKLN